MLIGSLLCTSTSFAGFFGDIVSTGEPELHVCTSGECGLDEGAALVKS
ncbi:MAG: hypothetical protein H6767_07515 [Candidatus Peribacteria bacterium]|nr:MAG: hypothetical protein H6767_07515 [Candidatus Peribacteria bacterium]